MCVYMHSSIYLNYNHSVTCSVEPIFGNDNIQIDCSRLGSKFKPISPEECRSVLRPKLYECDNKNKNKSPNNINCVKSYTTSSQK